MGKKIGLITGANAKIKINNKTMAYATDLDYTVEIGVIPAEAMGRFEVVNLEPVSYSVSGSFTVLRYTEASSTESNLPGAATGKSNSPNNWGEGVGSGLNPQQLLNSTTFDIDVYKKDGPDIAKESSLIKITDCRITNRAGGLNKGGLFTEKFNFVGILMRDDIASSSLTQTSGTI